MEQHLVVKCAKCDRVAEVSCVGCGAHVRPLPAEADTSATIILGEWQNGVPEVDGLYGLWLPGIDDFVPDLISQTAVRVDGAWHLNLLMAPQSSEDFTRQFGECLFLPIDIKPPGGAA